MLRATISVHPASEHMELNANPFFSARRQFALPREVHRLATSKRLLPENHARPLQPRKSGSSALQTASSLFHFAILIAREYLTS
jgi:hypothetical protein